MKGKEPQPAKLCDLWLSLIATDNCSLLPTGKVRAPFLSTTKQCKLLKKMIINRYGWSVVKSTGYFSEGPGLIVSLVTQTIVMGSDTWPWVPSMNVVQTCRQKYTHFKKWVKTTLDAQVAAYKGISAGCEVCLGSPVSENWKSEDSVTGLLTEQLIQRRSKISCILLFNLCSCSYFE